MQHCHHAALYCSLSISKTFELLICQLTRFQPSFGSLIMYVSLQTLKETNGLAALQPCSLAALQPCSLDDVEMNNSSLNAIESWKE